MSEQFYGYMIIQKIFYLKPRAISPAKIAAYSRQNFDFVEAKQFCLRDTSNKIFSEFFKLISIFKRPLEVLQIVRLQKT